MITAIPGSGQHPYRQTNGFEYFPGGCYQMFCICLHLLYYIIYIYIYIYVYTVFLSYFTIFYFVCALCMFCIVCTYVVVFLFVFFCIVFAFSVLFRILCVFLYFFAPGGNSIPLYHRLRHCRKQLCTRWAYCRKRPCDAGELLSAQRTKTKNNMIIIVYIYNI